MNQLKVAFIYCLKNLIWCIKLNFSKWLHALTWVRVQLQLLNIDVETKTESFLQ